MLIETEMLMRFLLLLFKICSVFSNYSSTCVVISNDCKCHQKSHFSANQTTMQLSLRCTNVKKAKRLELNASMFRDELLSFSIEYGSLVLEIPTGCFDEVSSQTIILQNLGIESIMKEAFRFHEKSVLQNLLLDGNNLHILKSGTLSGISDLLHLSVTNNKLEIIEDFALKELNMLEFLFLDNNRLKIINKHTFDGLDNLKILSLRGNFLDTIDERSFENLLLLNHLTSSNNNLNELPRLLLSNLSKLISIDLSSNDLEILDEEFLDETKALERLDLSENSILEISRRHVNCSSTLKKIILHGNPQLKIQNYTFSGLKHLSQLDVAGNKVVIDGYQGSLPPKWSLSQNIEYLDLQNTDMRSVADLFYVLESKTGISELRLSKNSLGLEDENENIKILLKKAPFLELIDMDSNLIEQINSWTFSNATRLKYIHVQRNRISKLSEYSFVNLQRLEVINIAGNRLRRLDNLTFVSLPSLSSVDLSSNEISFIDINSFLQCPSLRRLVIHGNKLPLIPRLEDNLFNLMILILDDNFIEKLENNSLQSFPALISLSSSNQRRFNSNHSLLALPSGLFQSTPAIATLNLQGCHLESLNGAFSSVVLANLKLLNLTRNALTTLYNNSFSSLPNLVLLDLSYNFISNVDQKAFDGLFNVKEVNLRHNSITEMSQLIYSLQFLPQLQNVLVPHNNFVYLNCCLAKYFNNSFINLQTLDISSNGLTELSHIFDALHQVQLINFIARNNLLTSLQETIEKPLTFVSEIDLSENKFGNGSQIKLSSLLRLKVGNFAGNRLGDLHKNFLDNSRQSVERLDFRNNLYLTCAVFQVLKKFINLKILQLSNNNIDCIDIHDNDSFPESIEELYMSKNRITFESLASGLKYFPALKYLDLASNHLKVVPNEIFELTKLQVLILNDNLIHLLQPIEQPPVLLHTLIISHNTIESLNESVFDDFSNLRVLDLSSNKLKKLSLPSHLQGLERIILRNNCFESLKDTPLSNLKLKNLRLIDISGNNITSEPTDSMTTVKSHDYLSIDISDNKLTSLEKFEFLGLFVTLNFSGNALRSFNYEQNGSKWEAEVADFSRNHIYLLDILMLQNALLRVKTLNFSFNEISEMKLNSSERLETLESLDLSRNNLSELNPSLLDIFPRLGILFLDGNNFKCSCEQTPRLIRTASERRIILSGIACQATTDGSWNDFRCTELVPPWTSFKVPLVPSASPPPFSKQEDRPSSQFNWGLIVGLPGGLLLLFLALAIIIYAMVGRTRDKKPPVRSEIDRETRHSNKRNTTEDRKSKVNSSSDVYYDYFAEEDRIAYVKFKDKSLFPNG